MSGHNLELTLPPGDRDDAPLALALKIDVSALARHFAAAVDRAIAATEKADA